MKNNKKQNEIAILRKMAVTVYNNITNIKSALSESRQTDFVYTDELFFSLLQTTDKNYFTPIEREDIFLLACHIQNLNDEINMLKTSIEKNRFFNSENTDLLANMLKNCITMLSELEKIPKCNGITQLYLNFRKDSKNVFSFKDNFNYENCIKLCNKIADTTYFSYLKNT